MDFPVGLSTRCAYVLLGGLVGGVISNFISSLLQNRRRSKDVCQLLYIDGMLWRVVLYGVVSRCER